MASPALASIDDYAPPHERAPALDLVHLARQSLGDRELESELLQLFTTQTAHILDRLGDPAVVDPRRRADLAHTLKGSARTVGAHAVACAAEAYEYAVVAGRPTQHEWRALAKAAREARAAIATLMDE